MTLCEKLWYRRIHELKHIANIQSQRFGFATSVERTAVAFHQKKHHQNHICNEVHNVVVHYLVNFVFRMPFYQFGKMLHLKCIPTEYWVTFSRPYKEKFG